MFDLVAETGAALVLVTHDPDSPPAPTGRCSWPTAASSIRNEMPLSLRFAARELRSGVAGFRIFLACLALGVAAIAAAGSTAEAFRHGLPPRRARSSAATSPSPPTARLHPRRDRRV